MPNLSYSVSASQKITHQMLYTSKYFARILTTIMRARAPVDETFNVCGNVRLVGNRACILYIPCFNVLRITKSTKTGQSHKYKMKSLN